MATSAVPISVPLKFLKWLALYETEKPFQIFINIPKEAADRRTTNLAFENVEVEIRDVRRFSPNHFQLDTHGFVYCSHPFEPMYTANRDFIEQKYLPEMESLLRSNVKDVDRVFFFDWRVCVTSVSNEQGR
jgi:hypothetical protein